MKILVFGFGPYQSWKENISEHIVRALKDQPGVETHIFPVGFNKRMFKETVKNMNPDAVIGLGQCSRGTLIRIERRAKNAYKHGSEKIKRINPNGPSTIPATLSLQPEDGARRSYDAGTYVCNFAMYVLGNTLKNRHIPFAFLHIPYNYPKQRAIRFVKKKIREVKKVRHPLSA